MTKRSLILLFLGAFFGVNLLGWDAGLWLGLIVGWLADGQWRLRDRLNAIERHLTGLAPLEPATAAEEILGIAPAPPEPAKKTAPPVPFDTAATKPAWPVSPPPDTWQSAASDTSDFSDSSELGKKLWAWVVGENPLVRMGVILLFFGVAFLLKYVAAEVTVPLELRFVGVALGGLGLLGVGWRLRLDRPGYAMVLQGGGIGVLYLTIFTATRFGLAPPELAFPLLVMIAVFSALLALWQDAPALALFGAAGGYLAPVLVSSGGGSHVQLFSYYALLNAGVLGLAWFKAWRSLNLLGFVFTFVIGGLWGHAQYRPEHFATTEPFLLLFFSMYVAIVVLFALRQPPQLKGLVDGSLVFGLPVVAFGLQAGLVHVWEFGLAWSALALGGFYLALSTWLWQRDSEDKKLRLLCESFLALGVVFITLAIPLAVDGHWTAAAWALEGAALVWVGVRQGRALARVSGLLLQFLAGIAFLDWHDPAGAVPVLNGRCLGGGLIALAGLFSALHLEYGRERLRAWEAGVHVLPLVWGLVWWYVTGAHEINRFLEPWQVLNALVGFLAISAAMGIALRTPLASRQLAVPVWLLLPGMAGILGLGHLGLHILFFFRPLMHLMPWIGMDMALMSHPYHPLSGISYDAWSLVFWGLAFGIQYLGLQRLDLDFPGEKMRRLWHTGTLWVLAWVLAWELAGFFLDMTGGEPNAWEVVAWGLVPAGLAFWVSHRGPVASPWPFATFRADYLRLGCGVLLAFAWGWALQANLTSDGMAWPLSYLPLLNPLDMALTFVLFSLLLWWSLMQQEHPEWAAIWRQRFTIGLAANGFLVLNGMVARTVHHWAGVPYRWHNLLASTTFQAALSLLWGTLALALMVTATRRVSRPWWVTGAVLLALVVAKLFLVELASHGTLARIISFLGVGVLLLIIGYLAPLPPKPETATGETR
ncbi:MAG: DUF2339 domain-containing protein [Pseudomonadota bacterium]